MASYKETFSAYYDALTEDVNRAVIADRCEELLAKYHPKRELALDLCCGTDTLATELARRGFEVIGVDASPEMLMQAAEKNMALEQPVLYRVGRVLGLAAPPHTVASVELLRIVGTKSCTSESRLSRLTSFLSTLPSPSTFATAPGCMVPT